MIDNIGRRLCYYYGNPYVTPHEYPVCMEIAIETVICQYCREEISRCNVCIIKNPLDKALEDHINYYHKGIR